MATQGHSDALGGEVGVAVGPAGRLLDQLLDDAHRVRVLGRALERLGRLVPFRCVPVEDGGAGLGADDAVPAVLEHEQPVADADGERAAGAALADDDADDGHVEAGHHLEADRDRLGLAALLGVDARVRARRVDEADHRPVEALRELHQPQRLAIPLGARHAEASHHIFFGGATFLVAEDQHRLAVEAGEAADQRRVVGEGAIAVQLDPVGEELLHVVERVGPVRVARELDDLPARQVAEDLLLQLGAALLEAADLDVEGVGVAVDAGAGVGVALELGELLLELQQRLLEVEREGRHGGFLSRF